MYPHFREQDNEQDPVHFFSHQKGKRISEIHNKIRQNKTDPDLDSRTLIMWPVIKRTLCFLSLTLKQHQ